MYLKRRFDGWSDRFSLYKVVRESKAYYFVRKSDICVDKVYKKHVGVGHEWSVATDKDFYAYRVKNLAYKVEKLIKATDFEKWSEEKLKNIISIIEQGGGDGEDSTRNPDD